MKWEEIVVLAVLALVVLVLYARIGRKKGSEGRAAKLMKKYADLPADRLAQVPDEEKVEAVVSHVLARAAESRRPDPVAVLAGMPQGFTVVYSVWAVCKEMAAGGFSTLKHTATREFIEPAQAGFTAIGATATAAAWQALYEAQGDAPEAEKAFRLAVQTECPLSMCEEYIRDNPDQFDGTPEAEA